MTPDLTEDDKAALVELLRETIERDRFPMSPSPGTSHLPPPLVPVGGPSRPQRRRDKTETEPTFPPLASMNLQRSHLSGRPSCCVSHLREEKEPRPIPHPCEAPSCPHEP